MDTLFSIVSFLASSSHDDDDETFVKENRRFRGGLYRRISPNFPELLTR